MRASEPKRAEPRARRIPYFARDEQKKLLPLVVAVCVDALARDPTVTMYAFRGRARVACRGLPNTNAIYR